MAWLAVGGAVLGGAASIFGGSSANKQKRKQAKRQNKYNKQVYEFQYGDVDSPELGGEALRKYEYAVEGLEIQKRNDETNLQFQEANLVQKYNYGMGVRQYEYNQALRAYDASVASALEQQEYNEMAEKFALVDQDRLLHEQLIDLSFDRTETLLDYRRAAAGLGLKQRQNIASAATEAQATRVSGLKAQGAAAARGVSGRSAAKNVQGIVAETGARQAAIIDELMFNQENTAVDFAKLNNQFIIDQVALDFSEESAKLSDSAARNRIKLQSLQAAMQAAASIANKPEIAPPLPKPFALPRAEYQDVYKPKKPPKPMKQVAMQTNLFAAGLQGAISGAQMGASISSSLGSSSLFGGSSGGGVMPKYGAGVPGGGLTGSSGGYTAPSLQIGSGTNYFP